MPRPIYLDHAAVIALLSEFSQAETARRMGLSEDHVQKIGRLYRGEYAGVRRPSTISAITGRPVVQMRVPSEFRDAGLADDYRDLCSDFGMAEGERRCRRLAAEMDAPPARHSRALKAEAGDPPPNGRTAEPRP